jgi:hypothetical protein
MEEIWKDLPDLYTRKYQVSNLGRIRSLDFTFTHPGPGRMQGIIITRKGLIMNPSKGNHKYFRISPTLKSGKRTELLYHWVVAEAFLGERPKDLWVLHKNGDRTNNSSENLYYGTPSQNTNDAYTHGNLKQGTNHHKAKLKEEDVLYIFNSKERPSVLAKMFGVDDAIPQLRRKGKIWKSVTGQKESLTQGSQNL